MSPPIPTAFPVIAFPPAPSLTIHARDLAVDLIARRVTRAGRPVDLRAKELDVLVYLMWNRNRIVSHPELLTRVWAMRFHPGTNRIEVTMSRLRDGMDRGFDQPLIHTFHGQGYMLADFIPEGCEDAL